MSEPMAYLNGRLIPASQAVLNVYDMGVTMGVMFTEFTRTFGHKAFRAEDHIDRLMRSNKYGNITLNESRDELLGRTLELIEHNCNLLKPNEDLGIVHFCTPGENKLYAGSAAGGVNPHATVCIHSFPLPFQYWRNFFTDGAHLVTPSIRHVPPQCVDPKTKNRSRIHWWLADQQSHGVDPKAVSLLQDINGNLTECSGANVVLYRDGAVYSPTTRNILEGISLDTVRQLAQEAGLGWVEKDLQPLDALTAEEVWLTTTPYCLAPCTRLNSQPIGDGKIGPVFHQLIEAWSRLVGMDILKQIMTPVDD